MVYGLYFLLFLISFAVQAQAPTWQQAVAAGSVEGSYSSVAASVADSQGNVYMAGSFAGKVKLGSITLINTTTDGLRDVFIAKWSSNTQDFVWVQQAGGPGTDVATAIALNGSSLYVAGWFTGRTARFGISRVTNADSTSQAGSRDIFVASLKDEGATSAFTDAQRAGGSADDYATSLATNGPTLYLAGGFAASASFGNMLLTSAGNTDIFITSLTDAGGLLHFTWAQRAGGQAEDYANSLASSNQAVYATGNFASATASFGPVSLANANPNGSFDVFVAKLTDAATGESFAWAQRAGGSGDDRANAVAVRGTSVYVAGEFQSAKAAFGSTTLTNAGTSGLYYDLFVTQLADAGSTSSFRWAQRAGGPGDDYGNAVAVGSTGVYVAGAFGGNVPGTTTANFGTYQLTSTNSLDIYVAKLTDTGTFAWAQGAGGTSLDRATSLIVSPPYLYVGGDLLSTVASFGNRSLTNPSGSITAFLALLTETKLLTTPGAALASSLSLVPNPAHSSTRVEWPGGYGATSASLTLSDMQGRVLATHVAVTTYPGLTYELPLSSLAPGVYLLRVQLGTATAERRLVVD